MNRLTSEEIEHQTNDPEYTDPEWQEEILRQLASTPLAQLFEDLKFYNQYLEEAQKIEPIEFMTTMRELRGVVGFGAIREKYQGRIKRIKDYIDLVKDTIECQLKIDEWEIQSLSKKINHAINDIRNKQIEISELNRFVNELKIAIDRLKERATNFYDIYCLAEAGVLNFETNYFQFVELADILNGYMPELCPVSEEQIAVLIERAETELIQRRQKIANLHRKIRTTVTKLRKDYQVLKNSLASTRYAEDMEKKRQAEEIAARIHALVTNVA